MMVIAHTSVEGEIIGDYLAEIYVSGHFIAFLVLCRICTAIISLGSIPGSTVGMLIIETESSVIAFEQLESLEPVDAIHVIAEMEQIILGLSVWLVSVINFMMSPIYIIGERTGCPSIIIGHTYRSHAAGYAHDIVQQGG